MSYYIRLNKAKTRYYGIVYYVDREGKRHQKSTPTFQYKREAKGKAIQLENELNRLNMELGEITFVDYWERWFNTFKINKAKSTSARNQYRIMLKFIKEYFGETKLTEISRSDYQKFINWYGANHARQSVSKLNGAIRNCVGYAIDDDIIAKDFTHNVELAYDNSKSKPSQADELSIEEVERLEESTTRNLNPHYTSRYMILTAIFTGMRKSEIQALTWKDIDYLHSTININKSWDERKKAFKSTKNLSSNRVIKVNKQLLVWLSDLKANGSTMVFQNIQGTIPTSTALVKCLHSIMHDASMDKQGFRFHSLRHVHVAYLLSQGVDIYAISKRLGHSNITITLDTYSYLIDEYKAKNDDKIINQLAKLI